MEAALAQVDMVSACKGLSTKDTLCLRLLAEETMAMVRAIAGNENGELWMEDEDQLRQYSEQHEAKTAWDELEKSVVGSSGGRREGLHPRPHCENDHREKVELTHGDKDRLA